MKKILLFKLLILFLFSYNVSAANYFGCASASLNSDSTFCSTPSGSCAGSSPVTAATALQAGNNLYANGCTISIEDSFTATKISTEDGDGAGAGVAGGGYTYNTSSVAGKTLTSNIIAGTTQCLTISGSGISNILNIVGNLTGGSATSSSAVLDSSTGNGSIITITGNVSGGSGTSAHGYNRSGNTTTGATITINGDVSSGSGLSNGYTCTSTYITTNINGSCIGVGSSLSGGIACSTLVSTAGRTMTITGNLVYSTTASPVNGKFIWNPASDSNFIKIPTSESAFFYRAKKEPAITDVRTGTTYGWDGSAVYTGTYVGGGGSWGF